MRTKIDMDIRGGGGGGDGRKRRQDSSLSLTTRELSADMAARSSSSSSSKRDIVALRYVYYAYVSNVCGVQRTRCMCGGRWMFGLTCCVGDGCGR